MVDYSCYFDGTVIGFCVRGAFVVLEGHRIRLLAEELGDAFLGSLLVSG
jgi:hypothetical protein